MVGGKKGTLLLFIYLFFTLQSHGRPMPQSNTTLNPAGELPHHRLLITSGAFVSSEQNQTATSKHTHVHTYTCTDHKYPTPIVLNCGWHIKGQCPRREVREGLGNHGRQRKRLRDKDQSEIWHFILGRSGRHTPFKEGYIATGGRRERRRRKGGRWGLLSSFLILCFRPSSHLSTVCF